MAYNASYDVDLAKKVGINAAALYNKLIYLSRYTQRKDGYCWRTSEEIENDIGLSKFQQGNAIKKLVEANLIKTKVTYIQGTQKRCKHFKMVESSYLRCFSESEETLLSESKETALSESKETKLSESQETLLTIESEETLLSESEETALSVNNNQYSNNHTNNHTVVDRKPPPKKSRGQLKRYGEYQNVLLSDDEYQKLSESFKANLPEYIRKLDEYIESNGYTQKYKNHYLTLKTWKRKDVEKIKADFLAKHPTAEPNPETDIDEKPLPF